MEQILMENYLTNQRGGKYEQEFKMYDGSRSNINVIYLFLGP